jgi:hypothetical protein
MKKTLRGNLSYANVISTLCLFLLVGGGTAFAASHLGKNSVGTKQLKKNAVTAVKLKKNAVTSAKIASGAVTGAKVASGSITGANINASTLGTVPNATNAANSATTNVVKGSHGTLSIGQQVTAFEYGPFKITVKCEPYNTTEIGLETIISSSTAGSAFSSWEDGGRNLGPTTPENEREIGSLNNSNSNGPYEYEGPSDTNVSASAANGQSFNAWMGEATEKDTNTCWYWLSANIIS